MDSLSDIAKVYLADIEVIAEGQRKLESELDAWWQEIVSSGVMPDLAQEAGHPLDAWINDKQPGQGHFRHTKGQSLLLEILDPRRTKRPFYTITLLVIPSVALKKIASSTETKKRLDQLAEEHAVGDAAKLNWSNTHLAEQDVVILPDDPEQTGKQLRDVARRFFRLVIEHGKTPT